ncbi:hypothetical protein P152DRAFT_183063 [Eremomyces bilateralis CBS 781.70]|uniref:WD40 repeat-like protein n=1 Tax=Eremomyces bilateralis CBS 781.70 TaxID=1392243 RepID=A0A6G1GBZ4_9PEZI|nr:uncharacterized protein P152DRAFT_183063 [Eremomyces bilateralis CBS 781.70]KAF1815359.1 hypothetical protein P152DRAFT_183063 [Eremomyces bilateralis CBS 781.70]
MTDLLIVVNRTKSPEPTPSPPRTSPPLTQAGFNPVAPPVLSSLGVHNPRSPSNHTGEWTSPLPVRPNRHPQSYAGGLSVSPSPPRHRTGMNIEGVAFGGGNFSHSPPVQAGMRPLSHPTQYTTFGGRMSLSPRPDSRDRRASMFSQPGQRLSYGAPPLPHEPQAHFYGTPNIDFGQPLGQETGLQPGENGYYCGFDTLSTAGDMASATTENVILVGYEGALDVYRIDRESIDLIGQIHGLRGSVVGAKILPWTLRKDPCQGHRPLVALILHNPLIPPETSNGTDSPLVDVDDHTNPSRSSSRQADRREGRNGHITAYQTTVEVYSLSSQERIAILYSTPSTTVSYSLDGTPLAPPPIGDLRIDAKGKFVVVASGTSGEVFIFSSYPNNGAENGSQAFRCIGKLWTTVQQHEPGGESSASSVSDANAQIPDGAVQYSVPLFSLSERWLAVVSPPSSSLFTLKGDALLRDENPNAPGVSSHTAPSQATSTCAVDMPDADTMFGWVSREVAKGIIKGAQWVGDQGVQAWKSYWNKPSPPNGQPPGPIHDPQLQYFPPTHAQSTQTPHPSNEPAPVSVFDLQRFLDAEESRVKNSLVPLATFMPPQGCSFLSFSPTGLQLLTVSHNGEHSFIWDLMRMTFGKTLISANKGAAGPHVRQIMRITRLTPAHVVDVVWSAPNGDKLALLTEKGTIHVHELPAGALQWPPPRRTKREIETAKIKEPESNEATSSRNRMSSAFEAINGATKPWLDTVRGRSLSSGSGIPKISGLSMTTAAGAGAKGGKVVAAGFGKSLTAATDSVHNLYHAGDNKLHTRPFTGANCTGTVRWLSGKDRGYLAVVAGGLVHIHAVKEGPPKRKGKTSQPRSMISKTKTLEFRLSLIPDLLFPADVADILAARNAGDPTPTLQPRGIWRVRAPGKPSLPQSPIPSTHPRSRAQRTRHPLSFAEIETNPPYQPFHTDSRVALFTFSRSHAHDPSSSPDRSDPHHLDDAQPWAFGEPLPKTQLAIPGRALGGGRGGEEDDEGGDGAVGRLMEKTVTRTEGGEEIVEQVVVTTRRRRRRPDREGDDEDDGFFEDDCDVLDFAEDRV